ncbi:MAG: hypothetical protein J7J91_00920 [Deltaproteobacteria bacterium]|nr:hypothetical protein [Deltaproteobacteria bacterium]
MKDLKMGRILLIASLIFVFSASLAFGQPGAAGVGAGATGAGGGAAAGISAAAVAGVSAAAAAAIAAGALSGDDSGISVLGIATSHETPAPEQPHQPGEETTTHEIGKYEPIITPTHIAPSHHSTAVHH